MQQHKMNVQKLLGLSLAALFMLSACRAPAAQEPTQDINALYTQVAATLIAQGQAPSEAPATIAPTNTPLVITATVAFATATASNTPVPPTSVPVAVCNQAAFIADITIPDGTQMSKGKDFTKTWRLKNTGTCTWDKDYTVVFSSGTNLANKSSYALPEDVSPGETVDISIPMEAPDKNGTYQSNWLIRSDSGSKFGVNGSGGSAGVPFFVLIHVGAVTTGTARYDFAANFCDADWDSHSKDNLPCPGANSGSNGFVLVLQHPELESGVTANDPAIWMRPNHADNGWIRGVFPDFEVKDGDHFVSTIGCLDNNSNCRVTFTLSYIKPNGDEIKLGSWDEKFDGLVRQINIDLSSLAGKNLNFVLEVEMGNSSFSQANAFWLAPVIKSQ